MSLRFRVEVNKKGARVAVLRIVGRKGGREITQQLGSFSKRKSPELLKPMLDDEEQYELENFLSTLSFSKEHFHKEVHELDRFIIKIAPEFKKALVQLWSEAKKCNLEFIPESEMLNQILNRAKDIEQSINEIRKQPINILTELGFDIKK